jgi:ribosome-binding factor A
MAHPRRILRLQQLILEVVAETLQREVRDPRIGMVSVTRVKLAKDMGEATVYWSSLGDERRHEVTANALGQARSLLQRRVAEALHTRVTPHLVLRFDPTLEHAQHLEGIFQHLREERGEPDADADPDAPPDASDDAPATPAG